MSDVGPKILNLVDDPTPQGSISPRVEVSAYTPDRDRELVRGRIAQWLLGLFILIIAAVLGGLLFKWLPIENLEKIGAIILSPMVALLGAVMGFYFGEQSRNRNG